ncbi:hypothetical protein [Actinoallomurus sp. NPDC052274]|uniref:hypothetical protein n=1 Tax=Actinoallomurus sp. NPDC052274 TaxID=3155420 RepID=UPI0034340CEA
MRIGPEIWDPAKERAEAERPAGSKTMTNLVKDLLRRYAAPVPADADEMDPWDLVNVVIGILTERGVQVRVSPDTDLTAAAQTAADLLRLLGVRPAPRPGRDHPPDET